MVWLKQFLACKWLLIMGTNTNLHFDKILKCERGTPIKQICAAQEAQKSVCLIPTL